MKGVPLLAAAHPEQTSLSTRSAHRAACMAPTAARKASAPRESWRQVVWDPGRPCRRTRASFAGSHVTAAQPPVLLLDTQLAAAAHQGAEKRGRQVLATVGLEPASMTWPAGHCTQAPAPLLYQLTAHLVQRATPVAASLARMLQPALQRQAVAPGSGWLVVSGSQVVQADSPADARGDTLGQPLAAVPQDWQPPPTAP